MSFNYQKAYCVSAVPAFEALPIHVKTAHAQLLPLVGDLSQGRDLMIPLTEAIQTTLEPLTTEEIARLSRASYFVGHWHPSLLPRLFETRKGESWKVSNCCDQVLRKRLAPLPHNIQIHEGVLRVTFSNRDCWLWKEFALATEKNLQTFRACGLLFGENTLEASAAQLKTTIGDLWPDVETIPDNDLYRTYLHLLEQKQAGDLQKSFEKKIADLQKAQRDAQKEVEFLQLCNRLHIPLDNVIYYSHTDTFCFGWRTLLSEDEAKTIWHKLEPMRQQGERFKVEFKKHA